MLVPKKAARKTPKIKNPAKIGTLRFVSRVTRASITKIVMFIISTRYDLATKKNFTNKYQKLAEIFSKNLENHGSLVYYPSNNGDVTSPQS